MTISEIKEVLKTSETIGFQLPDGSLVPTHFHVTEVGKISKDFIDCGGTRRQESVVSFQLWDSDDYDHRLHPEKLVSIIELSDKALDLQDLHIEVEYQGSTIGKYSLGYDGTYFQLESKQTTCLAKEECGIPIAIAEGSIESNSCSPDSGCC